jgi:hypothetical protein
MSASGVLLPECAHEPGKATSGAMRTDRVTVLGGPRVVTPEPKERPPARGGRFAPAVTVTGGRRWATAGDTPATASISLAP